MTAALKVIQPGMQTTVQDLGRTGGQSLGIPVSGAMDATALRAANVVVGNPQDTAGLEIALAGPTLEAAADSIRVALAGGTGELTIQRTNGESERAGTLQSVRLVRGDTVRVGSIPGSAVAYLAIEGGLDLAPFQGSLSTYVRGGFGGLDGRALRAGDLLPLRQAAAPDRGEVRLDGFDLAPRAAIRVVLGPQDDYFTPDALATFLGSEYVVSREADRMGMRLEGPALAHNEKGFNIVSDGIAPGAIQVPGNGLPIILLADRQSTGGYPKIATVISVDLPALGRTSPGARLRFERVTVETAQTLRREHEAMMRTLPERLVGVRAEGFDLERLLKENLVSGVIDGHADPHRQHH